MLTITALLPLLGALMIATVRGDNKSAIKVMALVTSILPLVSTIFLALRFDRVDSG